MCYSSTSIEDCSPGVGIEDLSLYGIVFTGEINETKKPDSVI
jgi:hypothetical protein